MKIKIKIKIKNRFQTMDLTCCTQAHCQGHLIKLLLSSKMSMEAITKRETKSMIIKANCLYKFNLYPCWNSVKIRIVDPSAR